MCLNGINQVFPPFTHDKMALTSQTRPLRRETSQWRQPAVFLAVISLLLPVTDVCRRQIFSSLLLTPSGDIVPLVIVRMKFMSVVIRQIRFKRSTVYRVGLTIILGSWRLRIKCRTSVQVVTCIWTTPDGVPSNYKKRVPERYTHHGIQHTPDYKPRDPSWNRDGTNW